MRYFLLTIIICIVIALGFYYYSSTDDKPLFETNEPIIDKDAILLEKREIEDKIRALTEMLKPKELRLAELKTIIAKQKLEKETWEKDHEQEKDEALKNENDQQYGQLLKEYSSLVDSLVKVQSEYSNISSNLTDIKVQIDRLTLRRKKLKLN